MPGREHGQPHQQRSLWHCPEPQSEGAHVKLKLVRYRSTWQLNGEPMTSAGEVIANIGIVMEEMERQLSRQQKG
jgi:hypothetical protein